MSNFLKTEITGMASCLVHYKYNCLPLWNTYINAVFICNNLGDCRMDRILFYCCRMCWLLACWEVSLFSAYMYLCILSITKVKWNLYFSCPVFLWTQSILIFILTYLPKTAVKYEGYFITFFITYWCIGHVLKSRKSLFVPLDI